MAEREDGSRGSGKEDDASEGEEEGRREGVGD